MYEAAYQFTVSEIQSDPIYYGAIGITISYNIGRLYEAKHEYDLAEKTYRSIIEKHPQYLDCFLRLGCMCRDRGQIHEASEWFKEALRINQTNPNIWSLIGNLHLDKEQLGPAQHQFDRILKSNEQDTYALVALGNIWLHTLYQNTRDKEKEKRHEQRALQMYKQVLKIDPRNIWAANGVGCVLAHKKLLNEARDIFAQVREATADFKDVWLNIAHILVEQGQFLRAIQMYENCSKKFYKNTNTELLTYLIRALSKANRLAEAKQMLLKARHVAPEDMLLMFNMALVQQKLSKQVMQDSRSQLHRVQSAIEDLRIASRTFRWLQAQNQSSTSAGNTEIERLREFKCDFEREYMLCEDLLAQAKHHLARAEKLDEEEREMKRRQELEIKQLKMRQEAEQLQREQEIEQQKLALIEKRAEILKKTENVAQNLASNIEKAAKKRTGGKRDTGEIVTSESENEIAAGEKKKSKSKSKKGGSKSKKRKTSENEGDQEEPEEESSDEEEPNKDDEEEEEAAETPKTSESSQDEEKTHKDSKSKRSKHGSKKKSKSKRM